MASIFFGPFFLGTFYRSASLYHPQRRAIIHLKTQQKKQILDRNPVTRFVFIRWFHEFSVFTNPWIFHEIEFVYSLISMRPIYYFDTWAIIWHDIACWFMFFPRFCQFLFVVIIKIFCTYMKIKNKNNLVITLRKTWEILWNLQKSSNNFMSNSG